MKIIEFYGNPGVGKSTAANALMEYIIMNNMMTGVNLRKDNYNGLIANKLDRLLVMVKAMICRENKVLKKLLYRFSCEYSGTKELKRWFVRTLVLNYVLQSTILEGKYEIIILDEGIIQHLSSLIHGNQIKDSRPTSDLCDYLSSLYHDQLSIIKCIACRNINVLRLRKRARSKDRFVYDDTNEMEDILNQKEANLEVISHKMSVKSRFVLNMDESIDQISILFAEMLS